MCLFDALHAERVSHGLPMCKEFLRAVFGVHAVGQIQSQAVRFGAGHKVDSVETCFRRDGIRLLSGNDGGE